MHNTAHLSLFASQEWLNTVHCVVQIHLKGSCCFALDIPAELSAKIVQVLFHFLNHTDKTETKTMFLKKMANGEYHKDTIYSQ